MPQLERLIYVSKIGHSLANTIVVDMHVLDKEHNCVLAKVLVIIIDTKLLDYYLLILPSTSADTSADLSADMPEDRFIKLKILLKHSRML